MSRPCSDLITWLRQQLDDEERNLLAGLVEHLGSRTENGFRLRLAEVAVDRRILDLHTPLGAGPSYGCPTCWEGGDDGGPMPAPCPTVRLLAQRHAGREGWREEWRV